MMDLCMTESNLLLVGRSKSSHDICKKSTCRKVQFADISIRPVARMMNCHPYSYLLVGMSKSMPWLSQEKCLQKGDACRGVRQVLGSM
jgi:hypothetical protein